MVDARPVRDRLHLLVDVQGFHLTEVAAAAGVSVRALWRHYDGSNDLKGRPDKCRKVTRDAIMAVRMGRPEVTPSIGTRRRLQALSVAGYTIVWMAKTLGRPFDPSAVHRIQHERRAAKAIDTRLADQVKAMYDQYAHRPADGITRAVYARNTGARNNWAGPGCWDDDTIDDPDAIPEWTGRCGTVWGWHIHKSQGTTPCEPCATAASMSSVEFCGDSLREWREKRNMSRPELSAATGIMVDTLRYWEIGRNKPRWLSALDPVMSVLDVTLEDLCTEIPKED